MTCTNINTAIIESKKFKPTLIELLRQTENEMMIVESSNSFSRIKEQTSYRK